MKIVLASDHAGVEHKAVLKEYLVAQGYEVVDMGTNSTESCDYPDFIIPAAKSVAADSDCRGVIFGGSGQGEAISANRIKGVRATTYYHHDLSVIELSREHNGANILSIGARFISMKDMKEAVDKWLLLNDELDERHERRIQKIDSLS